MSPFDVSSMTDISECLPLAHGVNKISVQQENNKILNWRYKSVACSSNKLDKVSAVLMHMHVSRAFDLHWPRLLTVSN